MTEPALTIAGIIILGLIGGCGLWVKFVSFPPVEPDPMQTAFGDICEPGKAHPAGASAGATGSGVDIRHPLGASKSLHDDGVNYT